ncbi:MAG: iron ABC transporter permease, partial [Bacteroidales bacterium]|nr:iron ABC transporter permease [Bacteroidales bacterium]
MAGKISKHITRFTLVLLLAVLILLPLVLLIIQWLTGTDNAVLQSFISQKTLLLIGKSILLSSLAALFATAIGTACALLLYKFKISFSGFYKAALLLPLFISPYIFAVAWKDGFYWLFGNTAAFSSIVGLVFVHTLVFFPLAMLIIGSALSQIHAGYEEAGLLIMPFRKMLQKIIFPLIRPALTISFLLVLIFSLSDFSVPSFFGVHTFTSEVFTQFSAFYNYQLAIGQSVLLLIICLFLLLAEARYLSDAPFFSIEVRGSISKKYGADKQLAIFHGFLLIILFIALLLPVFILIYQSFSGRMLFFGKAWELIHTAAYQSVKLAFAGALLITIIGLWAAYVQERHQFKAPNYLLLLTFIVPSTVLGIAFIRYYNTPSLNFIYGSVFIILITYISRFGFIASRIIGN